MFPKPKRVENRALLDSFHERPCLVCGRQSDPAHIKTRGSGGDDVEENVMALCRIHHTEQGAIGWQRMSNRYPPVRIELTRKGWQIDDTGTLQRQNGRPAT